MVPAVLLCVRSLPTVGAQLLGTVSWTWPRRRVSLDRAAPGLPGGRPGESSTTGSGRCSDAAETARSGPAPACPSAALCTEGAFNVNGGMWEAMQGNQGRPSLIMALQGTCTQNRHTWKKKGLAAQTLPDLQGCPILGLQNGTGLVLGGLRGLMTMEPERGPSRPSPQSNPRPIAPDNLLQTLPCSPPTQLQRQGFPMCTSGTPKITPTPCPQGLSWAWPCLGV